MAPGKDTDFPRPFAGEPLLVYVRPGPNALTWLDSIVSDLKAGDPFRPVTVLVPNDYAGRVARAHLARRGGFVNVSTLRLSQAAERFGRNRSTDSLGLLLRIFEASAIRAALRQHAGAFDGLDHSSLYRPLLTLFRELRRADVDVDRLQNSTAGRMTRAALDVYRSFRGLTSRYDDPTGVMDDAASRLARASACPTELSRLGAVILFLPARLDPADARFLAAAARWVPLVAAFIGASDLADPGGEPARAMANCLAAELGSDLPPWEVQPPPPTALETTRIFRAPDPAEEIREVVRRIATDLEIGIPLHRIAVVYRQNDPYAALTREVLDGAGFPWVSSEGERLAETKSGRSLIALLRLPEEQFSREAVLGLLDLVPNGGNLSGGIGVSACDRLTRAANVVRGPEQWRHRLETYAAALDQRALDLERSEAPPAAVEALRSQAAEARVLAARVTDLQDSLRSPPNGSSWDDFVAWAASLRTRYLDSTLPWSDAEQANLRAIDDVLHSLRLADRFDGGVGTTFGVFLGQLGEALAERRVATGTFGRGVIVEPVAAVHGLTFDRLYLVGMREGAFPAQPPLDPFFPPGTDDPLQRRATQRGRERRDFLTALAGADAGHVTLSVADSDGERAVNPSRWLLDIASQLEGQSLDGTSFERLSPTGRSWLSVIRSTMDGIGSAATPADLEDRRLSEVLDWTASGRLLRDHALARRVDLPLGRAVRLVGARSARWFTEFDGNVGRLAGIARQRSGIGDRQRPTSATALETWATCGYRYFLGHVLRVEPTSRPEDIWTISPLPRGGVVHKVLADYYSARRGNPRATVEDKDIQALSELADQGFRGVEQAGVTGHPLDWENTRQAIAADLRSYLTSDADARRSDGSVPSFLEQHFGFRTGDSWPPLAIDVAGDTLWFRGTIDRVDVSQTGSRAFVLDYKTGSSAGFGDLAEDPLAGGAHVQIALYSEVVRENVPGVSQVVGAFQFVSTSGKFARVNIVDGQATVRERLTEVVGAISQGITAGFFPQVPGENGYGGFNNCKYCDYDRICPARRDVMWRSKQDDPSAAFYRASETGDEPSGEE